MEESVVWTTHEYGPRQRGSPEGPRDAASGGRGEQVKRDELARALLRVRSPAGEILAGLVDLASLDIATRQQVVRVLGDLESDEHWGS